MPESSTVVQPEPSDGATRSASRRLQAAGLRKAISLFEKAAAAVPIPRSPRPIVIADYGAATGHNSLLPIGAGIAVLRKRTRPEHSVLVTHTDVPENDFTALFRTLSDDPDTYLVKDGATFASAVGRSYLRQILPSNSVNLGWSSWAIQWLSCVPMPVGDHVHVACSRDEQVRTAYAKQAAHDWHEFIAFRGRELCPGGRLVVMTMALDEAGLPGFRPLLGAMVDTLTELVAKDLITDDELHDISIPIVGRRPRDFLSPFAPSGTFEKLSISHLDVFDAEDRFFDQFRVDHDAKAFGARWAAFTRMAVFPSIASGLAGGPTGLRRDTFFDELEAGIAVRLAAAPEQTQIPMAQLVVEKRQDAHHRSSAVAGHGIGGTAGIAGTSGAGGGAGA